MHHTKNDSTSFPEYLAESSRLVIDKTFSLDSKKVQIVVGNEACDLDSAVSALVYAFHLRKLNSDLELVVIPVLNIPKDDFPLKTEVMFALQEQGISEAHLLFSDQIDTVRLQKARELKLTLVDHHVPVGNFKTLTDAVVEVIDHHAMRRDDEQEWLQKCVRTVELVGSCASLVAEKILDSPGCLGLSAVTSYLLYETILLDTVNFSSAARKATPKDRQMAEKLESFIASGRSRAEIFERLVAAKADMSGLTIDQALRKDLKMLLDVGSHKVAVCSLPVLTETFFAKLEDQLQIDDFCMGNLYTGVVVLGVAMQSDVARDMLLFSSDPSCLELMTEGLCHSIEVPLDLHISMFTLVDSRYRHFHQGNAAASRKQILPLLYKIFDEDNLSRSTKSTTKNHDDLSGICFNGDRLPSPSLVHEKVNLLKEDETAAEADSTERFPCSDGCVSHDGKEKSTAEPAFSSGNLPQTESTDVLSNLTSTRFGRSAQSGIVGGHLLTSCGGVNTLLHGAESQRLQIKYGALDPEDWRKFETVHPDECLVQDDHTQRKLTEARPLPLKLSSSPGTVYGKTTQTSESQPNFIDSVAAWSELDQSRGYDTVDGLGANFGSPRLSDNAGGIGGGGSVPQTITPGSTPDASGTVPEDSYSGSKTNLQNPTMKDTDSGQRIACGDDKTKLVNNENLGNVEYENRFLVDFNLVVDGFPNRAGNKNQPVSRFESAGYAVIMQRRSSYKPVGEDKLILSIVELDDLSTSEQAACHVSFSNLSHGFPAPPSDDFHQITSAEEFANRLLGDESLDRSEPSQPPQLSTDTLPFVDNNTPPTLDIPFAMERSESVELKKQQERRTGYGKGHDEVDIGAPDQFTQTGKDLQHQFAFSPTSVDQTPVLEPRRPETPIPPSEWSLPAGGLLSDSVDQPESGSAVHSVSGGLMDLRFRSDSPEPGRGLELKAESNYSSENRENATTEPVVEAQLEPYPWITEDFDSKTTIEAVNPDDSHSMVQNDNELAVERSNLLHEELFKNHASDNGLRGGVDTVDGPWQDSQDTAAPTIASGTVNLNPAPPHPESVNDIEFVSEDMSKVPESQVLAPVSTEPHPKESQAVQERQNTTNLKKDDPNSVIHENADGGFSQFAAARMSGKDDHFTGILAIHPAENSASSPAADRASPENHGAPGRHLARKVGSHLVISTSLKMPKTEVDEVVFEALPGPVQHPGMPEHTLSVTKRTIPPSEIQTNADETDGHGMLFEEPTTTDKQNSVDKSEIQSDAVSRDEIRMEEETIEIVIPVKLTTLTVTAPGLDLADKIKSDQKLDLQPAKGTTAPEEEVSKLRGSSFERFANLLVSWILALDKQFRRSGSGHTHLVDAVEEADAGPNHVSTTKTPPGSEKNEGKNQPAKGYDQVDGGGRPDSLCSPLPKGQTKAISGAGNGETGSNSDAKDLAGSRPPAIQERNRQHTLFRSSGSTESGPITFVAARKCEVTIENPPAATAAEEEGSSRAESVGSFGAIAGSFDAKSLEDLSLDLKQKDESTVTSDGIQAKKDTSTAPFVPVNSAGEVKACDRNVNEPVSLQRRITLSGRGEFSKTSAEEQRRALFQMTRALEISNEDKTKRGSDQLDADSYSKLPQIGQRDEAVRTFEENSGRLSDSKDSQKHVAEGEENQIPRGRIESIYERSQSSSSSSTESSSPKSPRRLSIISDRSNSPGGSPRHRFSCGNKKSKSSKSKEVDDHNPDSDTDILIQRAGTGRDEIWAVDLDAIEDYKNILSVTDDEWNTESAVVCLYAVFLPSRTTPKYEYLMQNLFRYMLSSLEQLKTKPYKLIFFNGAVAKNCQPATNWLHQCFKMIDRQMQENLQELIIVHPSFWSKAELQTFGRTMLSGNFYKRTRFADTLTGLQNALAVDESKFDYLNIPNVIKDYDAVRNRSCKSGATGSDTQSGFLRKLSF